MSMKVMRDLVGETLSERYRLVARVAGGGMGEVYRGHDLLLDRSVAVKILQPSLASDPKLVERFRMEARAAARLSHPNIVGVHDWGCEGDRTYYMVMEYVSGTDLRDILVARGSLQARHAVEIVASVCDALHMAHSKGLVHRDVKPENILLNRAGEVKVADFGIAIVVDADRTAPGGMIPGTLRYLSPEQARGGEATASSDLWSAGAVLSELLTGLPPLQGSGGDLLARRAQEPPRPPSSWDPEIPRELDEIVMKACALEPSHRFGNAAEMAGALRRLATFRLPAAEPLESLLDQVTGEIAFVDPDYTLDSNGAARPRKRARLPRVRSVLGILLVLLLLVGTAGAVTRLVMPQMVDVPRVTDLPRTVAEQRIDRLGLEALVVGSVHDMEVPKGSVVSQSPTNGELEEGSTIELTLSRGKPKVRLPLLLGLTQQEAEKELEANDLVVGEVTKEYSLEQPGTVVRHNPDRSRLVVGTTVDLVVSKGPQPLEVPDVSGMRASKAELELRSAGFDPVSIDAYSDEVKEGFVISTSPGPAEMAGEGTRIEVYVSIGPEFEKVKVPDVRGMDVASARARLEDLGFEVTIERPYPGGSTVLETNPLPGTMWPQNKPVALFVG
jgi:eukaryotic-like serine/threonine-protein kinase